MLLSRLIAIAFAGSGLLAAAETADAPPTVTFQPAAVRLVQDFHDDLGKKVDAVAATRRMRDPWGGWVPGLSLSVDAAVGSGLTALSLGEPTIVSATLDSGETLSAIVLDEMSRRIKSPGGRLDNPLWNQRVGDDAQPLSFQIALAAPLKAAAAIKTLRGTIDLTYATAADLKHLDLTPPVGPPKPIGIDGCDLSIGLTEDGKVAFEFAPEALSLLSRVVFLGSDGSTRNRQSTSTSGGERQKVQIGCDGPVAKIALDVYATTRTATVTFELKDLPLVGRPDASALVPRPALEVHVHPAVRRAATGAPATPAPAAPKQPGSDF